MDSGSRRYRGSAGMTNQGGYNPGLIGASGRRQVMVITTAAAATNRMAMAAVSTVMQVASVLTSPSRRARKAARCGGMVGIAGRESIKMPSSTRLRRERTHRLCAVRIARLLRRAGQEGGQQHDEAARQPEQFGGNNQTHEITHAPVH